MKAAIHETSTPSIASSEQGRAAGLACLLRQRADNMGSSSALLGHERDLINQYGVSRGTLRSAIRELERQGIVRMVPGRRGGLYVSDTSVPLAARDLGDYLAISDAPTSDIAHFAMHLYRLAAVLAARRCAQSGPETVEKALALVSEPPTQSRYLDVWSLSRRALVIAADNSALTFLHAAFQAAYRDALNAELHLGTLEAPRTRALWILERNLVQTVATGRTEEADRAAAACTDLEASYLRQTLADGMLSPTLRPETLYQARAAEGKLAHQTLRALHATIRQSRTPMGVRLGSVVSLAKQFGVSTDVMRDTLRQGQRSGLVRLRRGRSGGVFAASPCRDMAVDAAASYLRTHAVPREIQEIRMALKNSPAASGHLAIDILRRAIAKE